ncbi:hypothetical protein ACFVKB_38055 [Rhodococcus sp. NPDC127530]|uniref:hypothetical protein n=1 Tax=unclassified Rhodococcus (in: high G+C Gram-positive bacteria) TaxID=192944 RepID=UPI00362F3B39
MTTDRSATRDPGRSISRRSSNRCTPFRVRNQTAMIGDALIADVGAFGNRAAVDAEFVMDHAFQAG